MLYCSEEWTRASISNTVYRSKKYSKKRLFEISIDRIADQWIPDNGSNRDVHPWHLPSGFHVSRPIGFVNDDSRRHDPFSSVRGKIALPAVNPFSRERNLAARLIVRDRIFLSPLEGHDALLFFFFLQSATRTTSRSHIGILENRRNFVGY